MLPEEFPILRKSSSTMSVNSLTCWSLFCKAAEKIDTIWGIITPINGWVLTCSEQGDCGFGEKNYCKKQTHYRTWSLSSSACFYQPLTRASNPFIKKIIYW